MSVKPLTPKELAFVAEYLRCENASEAYRKSHHYNGDNANRLGHRMLTKVDIQAEIARRTTRKLEKLELKADDVVERLTRIALADPSELSQHRIGACRFCYGIDHEFQWLTQREFREALLSAKLRLPKKPTRDQKLALPSDEGGFGYDRTRAPNPKCPECNGLGKPFIQFADTTKLSDDGRLLFEAVEQTNTGLKLKITDRAKALDTLARHLGVLKEKHEHDVSDGLAQLLGRVQGSTLTPKTPKNGPVAPLAPDDAGDEP